MGTVGFVGFISLLLGVVWYGGRSVMSGHSTPGSLLAFFMAVTIISGPMGSLAALYTRLQRAVGAVVPERLVGIDAVVAGAERAAGRRSEHGERAREYARGPGFPVHFGAPPLFCCCSWS